MTTAIKYPQFILAVDEAYLSKTMEASDGLNNIPLNDFYQGANAHLVIRRRQELESNENYLQILPYAAVARRTNKEDIVLDQLKFAAYYRPVSGGEARLHGNLSVGFGGHIDLSDVVTVPDHDIVDLEKTVLISMARELSEELGVSFVDNTMLQMGLITDKSNAVGRVHLGMVFILVVDETTELKPKVDEVDFAGEFTAAELWAKEQAGEIVMENWTKIIVKSILGIA